MSTFFADYPVTGGGVTSLNGLTGALTLVPGAGITITPSGSNITIAATGAGSANTFLSNLTSPTSINQSLFPNADNTFGIGSSALAWTSIWTHDLGLKATGSGSLQMVPNPSTTSYLITWPGAQGTGALQNDGAGNLSWTPVSSGANTALSNLAAVAINTSLLPGVTNSINLGSATDVWASLYSTATRTGALTTVSGIGSITVGNNLAMGTNAITGLANPVNPQDAATKAYVDSVASPNAITALTGDVTATGPGSVAAHLVATTNATLTTLSALSLPASQLTGTGNLTDVGTDGIVITNGTGAVIGTGTSIAQHVADTTHNGYLSSVDWNTFNGKQPALTLGNLTDAGTDGITVTGGTGAVVGTGTSLSQHVADTTHNGYLSSVDWNTFNSKQAAGNYITALTGDVTATGPGSAAASLVATTNATLTTLSGLTTASSLATVGTITTGTWNGTTIDTAHGGTGQTTYTNGQLLIGNSTGNTLTKASLTAGSGITITPGSGSITIASTGGGAPSLAVVSQSSTLNPAALGTFYILSGASFNITLPTAAGVTGQTVTFLHNGTSITQVYTLLTTSAQTIGGIASGSYALFTNQETLVLISDGANWQIQDHRANTSLSGSSATVVTATTTNPVKGTTSVDSARWKREGQYAWCYYEYNQTAAGAGTAGSGNYLFAFPAGLTLDTTLVTINNTISAVTSQSTNIGTFTGEAGGASSGSGVVAIPFSSTQFRIVGVIGGAQAVVGSTTWAFSNTTVMMGGWVKIPITGWQP